MSARFRNASRSWILISCGLVLATALFSSTREKPVFVFAAGFGVAIGMAMRLLADALNVQRNRQMVLNAGLLAAGGFAICFVASYSRAARAWDRMRSQSPSDPIAAALIKSAEQDAPAIAPAVLEPYSWKIYLARRFPGRSAPWPVAAFGAEWMLCVGVASLCVGVGKSAQRDAEP